MYECTVHHDHVSCTCHCYKYNALCKHRLCVANKEGILKEHIDFLLKSPRRAKPVKSGLVEPEKNAAGKKGGTHKNPWRPSIPHTSSTPLTEDAQGRPFTEIHHNNEPLVVCFLSDEPRAIECKQCGTAFPRRLLVAPYDIMLSHSEKWMYPDPKCPGNKVPSARYTTKYYCIKKECVMTRFPYFNSRFFEIPEQGNSRLKDAHRNLIKEELGC